MAFEIERNRRLYREADDGLPALPGASRRCVATARVLYARILERIEAADYDVFDSRARVSTPAKAALAARMVVSREPMRLVRADRAARDPHDGAWVSDDPVVLLDDAGSRVGQAPKSVVHHDDTPLHLAFSCYVVDPSGRLLVTDPRREQAELPRGRDQHRVRAPAAGRGPRRGGAPPGPQRARGRGARPAAGAARLPLPRGR